MALQAQRLALAREFVTAARKKIEGGYAPEFEATKAEVEVVAAQKAWRETRAQADAARIMLNSLMGNPPDAPLTVAGALSGEVALPETFALLDLALRRNPALQLQAAEAERTGLSLRSVRKSRLPDFTVGPQVEYTRDEQTFDFGISLPLPLWNNKRGEIASATAEQEKALAELDQLKQEILRDVTIAAKNYEAARDSLAYYLPALREKLQSASVAAAQGYTEGRTPLLLYLETQRTYFDTQAGYFATLQKLYAALADVESAVGIDLEPFTPTPLQ
jgi:cobalt-zinc-cadmium efflux system outer membrane protein